MEYRKLYKGGEMNCWSLSNIKIPCYDAKEFGTHEECKDCILKRGCEERIVDDMSDIEKSDYFALNGNKKEEK